MQCEKNTGSSAKQTNESNTVGSTYLSHYRPFIAQNVHFDIRDCSTSNRRFSIQVVNKGAIQHIEDKIRVFEAVHTICRAML